MMPAPKKIAVVFFVGALIVADLLAVLLYKPEAAFAQTDAEQRSQLEQQLQQLEQQAQGLDTTIKQTQSEAKDLATTKKTIDLQVQQRELQIKKYNIVITKSALEISRKKSDIADLTKKIEKSRQGLSASILLLYTYGQENPLMLLLKHANLSDFFNVIHALNSVQSNIQTTMTQFKNDRQLMQQQKDELEGFEQDQQDLKALQEVERRFLAQKQKEKDELLKLTKGKEAVFQQLLKSKQKDIAALKTQLYYIERTGITAETAVQFADLAAKRVGIRTAFLLALLEVETGKQFEDGVITVGTNLGTGKWKRDLYDCYVNLGKRGAAEAEKSAFMRITSSLGLDPDKMPVSRKPDYGCGGAMGPAQFLPTTWLRFSDRVAQLTSHNPANPWNPEDAFQAAAVFLADAGADSQSDNGEIAAARTYISGNPSCTKTICKYYSSRVMSLSQEISKIL